MSKHPGPWTAYPSGHILDANGGIVCDSIPDDPEMRAVLLHAGEMWNEIRRASESDGTYDVRWARAVDLRRKIEAEIAGKGKPAILDEAKP